MKKCIYCNSSIGIEEKAVLLKTYVNKKNLESKYFHLSCYDKWFNSTVDEKFKNMLNASVSFIKGIDFKELNNFYKLQ